LPHISGGSGGDGDDDDTSDHDFSLHKPFMKRKTGGAHLKELSEWKDGDFEPEGIFFDTTKACIQMEYHGLISIIFIKTSLCEELIELIVTESNRNYQKIVQTKKSPPSCQRWWRETDVNEMYTLLAVNMLMVRNKNLPVSEYWSTDRLLCSPIFREITPKTGSIY